MRLLLKILLGLLFLLAFLFAKDDDIVKYVIIPIGISIPLSLVISCIIWWFKPEWSNNDWPYMTDRQRKKYLKEQELKRKAFTEKWKRWLGK